jgi:hypothetical protein
LALVGTALLAAALGVAAPADAGSRSIARVEVQSMVTREGRDMRELLRSAVERELGRINWGSGKSRKSFVLSTSLVQLDTERDTKSSKASCMVSVSLRDEKQGALRAMIQGRARAEDSPNSVAQAEDAALEGAVRGAMKGLPETLERMK